MGRRKEVEQKSRGKTRYVPPNVTFISRVSYAQWAGTLSLLFFHRDERLPAGATNATRHRDAAIK